MLIVLIRNFTKLYAVSIGNGGGQRGRERGKGKRGERREWRGGESRGEGGRGVGGGECG